MYGSVRGETQKLLRCCGTTAIVPDSSPKATYFVCLYTYVFGAFFATWLQDEQTNERHCCSIILYRGHSRFNYFSALLFGPAAATAPSAAAAAAAAATSTGFNYVPCRLTATYVLPATVVVISSGQTHRFQEVEREVRLRVLGAQQDASDVGVRRRVRLDR